MKLGMKVSLGDTKNIMKQKHNCAKGAKDISKKNCKKIIDMRIKIPTGADRQA